MKDSILNLVNMNDILDKYSIKRKRSQFCCPFHKDNNPSAKAYEKSFYCFGCNKTGDVIQFVQYLFNIPFKDAMQKINEDFNLGLNSKVKLDYYKIKKIQTQKDIYKKRKEQLENNFKELCKIKQEYNYKIDNTKLEININNWQEKVSIISTMQDIIGQIDIKLDDLLDEMYILKNSNY